MGASALAIPFSFFLFAAPVCDLSLIHIYLGHGGIHRVGEDHIAVVLAGDEHAVLLQVPDEMCIRDSLKAFRRAWG